MSIHKIALPKLSLTRFFSDQSKPEGYANLGTLKFCNNNRRETRPELLEPRRPRPLESSGPSGSLAQSATTKHKWGFFGHQKREITNAVCLG